MCIKKAFLITCFSMGVSAHAGLILHQGESFTWPIHSGIFDSPGVPWIEPVHHMYTVWDLDIGQLGSDEVYRVTLFEDGLLDAAFFAKSYTNNGASGHALAGMGLTSDVKWGDLQGVFKIDVLRGSVDILQIDAHTIVAGEYMTASVPEPEAATLFMIGAVGLFLGRQKRQALIEERKMTPRYVRTV
ncbi:hypothetical protein PDESU_01450 [Pontiella desulfatans]|uniref:PEP-CTERM protein-sorting domain-containing protein n=1 Tax=Pontiella desulfatans TaxID=2750659 RepID=A0A6C2U0H4_PONDE|nr:hypothetical protein [Pontiella desulfatans]VGO12896.1 hypothetical protein PDESU_01450 [Pontiella desulfatans]